MSWTHLFKKANAYAQASAEHAIDEHADPEIQLEQAITAMGQHHNQLMDAAAGVIATQRRAAMKLHDLTDQENRLVNSIKAAQAQKNETAARSFALQLSSIQDQIKTLAASMPQLEAQAAAAKEACQESADQLQAKIAERNSLKGELANAKMNEQMAAATKAVTDLTGQDAVPSFDAIKEKIQAREAKAQGTNELLDGSPEVQMMHTHHAELTSQADDILAQISAGTFSSAALAPAPVAELPSAAA